MRSCVMFTPWGASPETAVNASPGAASGQKSGDRLHEDLEVEPGAPVLDVEVIPLDAVGERRVATQPVDLGPAGEPGLHAMTVGVAVDRPLEQLDVVESLGPRADQRHVAA